MYEVTCFHCTNQVEISPDASLCPECGEDLQHLLATDAVVHYFQTLARELSAQGQLTTALAEAERGLTFAPASELRLLAAILAKQLGRPDRMRQHVAAIPVDDSLRGEAEWLLRSHQDPQRALREAQRATQPNVKQVDSTPASTFLDDLLGRNQESPAVSTSAGPTILALTLAAAALALVVASWWWIGPGALPDPTAATGEEAGVVPTGVAPTPAPARAEPAVIELTRAPTAAATRSLLPTPTPVPAPTLPNDVVNAPGGQAPPQEVASAGPRPVLVIESNLFDLAALLRAAGEPGLAALPVEARLVGDTLVLQGFVQLDLQRRTLIQVAGRAPGVRQVNAVDVLVRPAPTYIVQEGDTLWSIVYNIYGNVDRLDEFAAANRELLPSPDALAPGLELIVLPVQ